MPAINNEQLKKIYDEIYKKSPANFFSKYVDGQDISETDVMVLTATEWENKMVLDVGCGTGNTASLIAAQGAKRVVAIDYSHEAIETARHKHSADNLEYRCLNLLDWTDPVDVVVSCGTLEHLDKPWDTLLAMGQLIPIKGEIIITCPCFLNIRGYIWMTLQTLLNVPMSLTDVHFISPFDIEEWLKDTPLRLTATRSFDYSKGNGSLMLTDLSKRLTNALKDAGFDNTRVKEFITWLKKMVDYNEKTGTEMTLGATALYVIEKQNG